MSRLPRAQLVSYLASHAVRAQLPKAQGGLNPPEQGHHIQVLDATPRRGGTGGRSVRRSRPVAQDSGTRGGGSPCRRNSPRLDASDEAGAQLQNCTAKLQNQYIHVFRILRSNFPSVLYARWKGF